MKLRVWQSYRAARAPRANPVPVQTWLSLGQPPEVEDERKPAGEWDPRPARQEGNPSGDRAPQPKIARS